MVEQGSCCRIPLIQAEESKQCALLWPCNNLCQIVGVPEDQSARQIIFS